VEVRSAAEIFATLDENGRIDGLPFMPEMLAFCGRTFRVSKRADKTCDTVNYAGLRRLRDTVHLEATRCDGSAHGGCQAECLLFWKEAWLRPADEARGADTTVTDGPRSSSGAAGQATEGDHPMQPTLIQLTRRPTVGGPDGDRYFCQATELPAASSPLPWWDPTQYVRDVRSGNVGVAGLVAGMGRWLFVKFQANVLRRGAIPFVHGHLTRTPTSVLNLQPGERVRVKSKKEIEQTLDRGNRNRGLSFDSEFLPYCGREFVVRRRVERIIDEPSGRMIELQSDCLILDDVVCGARYHRFCPRQIYPYWREIWLTRVSPIADTPSRRERTAATADELNSA
jgi:hypothetical protein